mmetsp:Transcript_25599/g.60152  ORF Transcript_25599/g.60152 Transcript_25599/m.60152 type:complete len:279 (-) Transcript_25599:347-1183(-)
MDTHHAGAIVGGIGATRQDGTICRKTHVTTKLILIFIAQQILAHLDPISSVVVINLTITWTFSSELRRSSGNSYTVLRHVERSTKPIKWSPTGNRAAQLLPNHIVVICSCCCCLLKDAHVSRILTVLATLIGRPSNNGPVARHGHGSSKHVIHSYSVNILAHLFPQLTRFLQFKHLHNARWIFFFVLAIGDVTKDGAHHHALAIIGHGQATVRKFISRIVARQCISEQSPYGLPRATVNAIHFGPVVGQCRKHSNHARVGTVNAILSRADCQNGAVGG